ncbi:hypothetical protein C1I98_00930 [Spongiactinospora gelatinilytica]|uniref:Uncharacterized protein n=1 Tax=Spongiactinospora gelatinilytica TaxID=2666298 RepID=A0A2W2H801_9ACTN|nr:hypothetical protein [Spongiactinospora gelatinilytica]PZG56642.1 hypothetical protein C1I98_00930 [Spongiactinospora gelatinilytica]
MPAPRKYSQELRELAVRMVFVVCEQQRPAASTADAQRIAELKREVREGQAIEIRDILDIA